MSTRGAVRSRRRSSRPSTPPIYEDAPEEKPHTPTAVLTTTTTTSLLAEEARRFLFSNSSFDSCERDFYSKQELQPSPVLSWEGSFAEADDFICESNNMSNTMSNTMSPQPSPLHDTVDTEAGRSISPRRNASVVPAAAAPKTSEKLTRGGSVKVLPTFKFSGRSIFQAR